MMCAGARPVLVVEIELAAHVERAFAMPIIGGEKA